MRRFPAAIALGVVLLAGSACGTDADNDTSDPNFVAACAESSRLNNEWSMSYGNEMGAVGEAKAAGDTAREETAVAVVKELYTTWADGLREQAGTVPDTDLATALNQMADGLVEIADGIETYDDVVAAPGKMGSGTFADGGAKRSEYCAL